MRSATPRRLFVFGTAVFVAATLAAPALACPVCFGDTDSPMMRGAQLSIVFLAIVTYLLITGGVVVFLVLRRRAVRRLREEGSAAPAPS